VISQKCNPCHTGTGPAAIGISVGHLDMTTQAMAYTDLVNVPTAGASCAGVGTRVVPGNAQNSIMYLKVSLVDPAPCGAKMPFGLPPLAQSEVDLIKGWINGGALND
jgi:hypothetical protein